MYESVRHSSQSAADRQRRQFSNLGAPFAFGLCVFHSCSDAPGSPIPSHALCLPAFFKDAFPVCCLMPMNNTALNMTMGKGMCCRKNKCMTSSSDQNPEPFKPRPLVTNSSLSPAPLEKAPKRQSGPLSVLILGLLSVWTVFLCSFHCHSAPNKVVLLLFRTLCTPISSASDERQRIWNTQPRSQPPAAREELSRAGFLLCPRVSGPELEPVRIL